jgi:hypothetical protein
MALDAAGELIGCATLFCRFRNYFFEANGEVFAKRHRACRKQGKFIN